MRRTRVQSRFCPDSKDNMHKYREYWEDSPGKFSCSCGAVSDRATREGMGEGTERGGRWVDE